MEWSSGKALCLGVCGSDIVFIASVPHSAGEFPTSMDHLKVAVMLCTMPGCKISFVNTTFCGIKFS